MATRKRKSRAKKVKRVFVRKDGTMVDEILRKKGTIKKVPWSRISSDATFIHQK